MTLPNLSAEDQALRDWLLAEAEEIGHAVVSVAEDESGAPYCFTVGAWRRFGLAEAVVVGLPDDMAPVLLRAYVQRARAGQRFVPGGCYEGFFDGVPVAVEKVAASWFPEFFGSAFLLYPTGSFAAVQLIVPTPGGDWPWAPGAPEGFAAWQPVLTESGAPESWTPGVDGP